MLKQKWSYYNSMYFYRTFKPSPVAEKGVFRSPERVTFCLHRKSPKMPQRGHPFGIPADKTQARAVLLGAA